MPALSESLVFLEQRLADALLGFERLDAAWPRGRTAIERAEIDRWHEEALSEIQSLRQRIATGPAENLADAAVQFRRLTVERNPKTHTCAGCLTSPKHAG